MHRTYRLPTLASLLLVVACGKRASAPAPAPPTSAIATAAGLVCDEERGLAATLDVAEASAAPLVPTAGGPALLVLSDSGNHGEALSVPIAGGPPVAARLPLDEGASDDLEGAAFVDGRLYTLTSSGAVRTFAPDGAGWKRTADAYRIGDGAASCPNLDKVNCGRNYESLCLRPAAVAGRPRGWAGARDESTLYPVALGAGGQLAIDVAFAPIRLPVAARSVSDCAFAPSGELLVVTNVHDGNRVFVVGEPSGELRSVDVAGLLNLEAVAADGAGRLWIFADTNGRPSAFRRFACTGWRVAPGGG